MTTLPQVLKTAGYTSGIFGKWHLGDEEDRQPHNRGFDEAFIHGAGGIGQAYACSCADAPGNKYFDPTIRHNGSFVKTKGFCTDLFFTAAMGWIKEKKDGDAPFFAYITTNAPHGPFIAPPKNRQRFTDRGFSEKQAGFYGMIENIDENVGRLLTNLEKWKMFENTVVIFTADNGPEKYAYARDEKFGHWSAHPLRGLKRDIYEGGHHVPYIVKWPGITQAGQVSNALVSQIDIMATLASAVGADLPDDAAEDSHNLLPVLKGKVDSVRTTHVHNTYENKFAIRNGDWLLIDHKDGYTSGRNKPWETRHKYPADNKSPVELYNLNNDIGQRIDLARKQPERVAELQALLSRIRKQGYSAPRLTHQ